jgi:hypothetical protein
MVCHVPKDFRGCKQHWGFAMLLLLFEHLLLGYMVDMAIYSLKNAFSDDLFSDCFVRLTVVLLLALS